MTPSTERKIISDIRALSAAQAITESDVQMLAKQVMDSNVTENIGLLIKRVEALEQKVNSLENTVEGLLEAGKRKIKAKK